MLHKIFAFITCAVILMSTLTGAFTASAEGDGIITVEKTVAATGDTVFVDLTIADNPGIMAITVSITYDPEALTFVKYYYGDVFSDYTVAAHPDKKHIRLVISEKKDKTANGTIASFQFQVADNAEAGLHEMTVEYSSGDFCNYDLVRLMPTIVPGGVDVKFNGNNCSHKSFNEWESEVAPTCTKPGIEQRICKNCPHTEHRETKTLGHTFSDKFTVDTPATEDTPGTMSRHCIRCDATTNTTMFTLEESDKGELDNKPEAEVPDNEVIKDIILQQHPDIDKEINADNPIDGTTSDDPTSSDENISTNPDDEQDSAKDPSVNTSDTETNNDKDKQSASTIADKLYEAIPEISNIIKIIIIALLILFVIILI